MWAFCCHGPAQVDERAPSDYPTGAQATRFAGKIRSLSLRLETAPASPEFPIVSFNALMLQSVGPKVALAVLSGAPPRELLKVVAGGDVARLQAAPGVGKRTAERIIVELREKVGAALPDDSISIVRSDDPVTLAREALLGLGYSAGEIDGLLHGAPGDSTEDLIAHALRSARR